MTDPMKYKPGVIPADRIFVAGPTMPILTITEVGEYLMPAIHIDDPRLGTVVVILAEEELRVLRDFCDTTLNADTEQRRKWYQELQQQRGDA